MREDGCRGGANVRQRANPLQNCNRDGLPKDENGRGVYGRAED